MKKTPRKSRSIVENDDGENEAGDEHEEESEYTEEEDEQVVQPIDPRFIEVLNILLEERQKDVVI